jgi:hypothetical protein
MASVPSARQQVTQCVSRRLRACWLLAAPPTTAAQPSATAADDPSLRAARPGMGLRDTSHALDA